MDAKALICGLRGLELSDDERAFIAEHRPWGFIIFGRNVESPAQLRSLTDTLRAESGREVPILIDQEGGRVQRLKAPHWPTYPAARALGALYERDAEAGLRATYCLSRLHAFDLSAMGINVDCLPVLDVPSPDGHDVIGDRAYGDTVEQVRALGAAACDGLLAGGVAPVIKHIPGHGRATADSHHDLPVVDADLDTLRASDFGAFTGFERIAMAMTAHVIYSAVDADRPATTSPKVMQDIVRGELNYDGLVMCDDITMGALQGDLATRSRDIIDAGCDVILHCTGRLDEMEQVARHTPWLDGDALRRARRAEGEFGVRDGADEASIRAEFADLMGETAVAAADPTNYGATA